MYICLGHFLAEHIVVMKDGKPLGRLMAVDTDLMVAQRIVGFNSETGEVLQDLVKVDQVLVSDKLPEGLRDLVPAGMEFSDLSTVKYEDEEVEVEE